MYIEVGYRGYLTMDDCIDHLRSIGYENYARQMADTKFFRHLRHKSRVEYLKGYLWSMKKDVRSVVTTLLYLQQYGSGGAQGQGHENEGSWRTSGVLRSLDYQGGASPAWNAAFEALMQSGSYPILGEDHPLMEVIAYFALHDQRLRAQIWAGVTRGDQYFIGVQQAMLSLGNSYVEEISEHWEVIDSKRVNYLSDDIGPYTPKITTYLKGDEITLDFYACGALPSFLTGPVGQSLQYFVTYPDVDLRIPRQASLNCWIKFADWLVGKI